MGDGPGIGVAGIGGAGVVVVDRHCGIYTVAPSTGIVCAGIVVLAVHSLVCDVAVGGVAGVGGAVIAVINVDGGIRAFALSTGIVGARIVIVALGANVGDFAGVRVAGIHCAVVAVVDVDGCIDTFAVDAGVLGAGVIIITVDGDVAAALGRVAGVHSTGVVVIAGSVIGNVAAPILGIAGVHGAVHFVSAVHCVAALAFASGAGFTVGADIVVVALGFVVSELAAVSGIARIVGAGIFVIADQLVVLGTFAISAEFEAVADIAVVTSHGGSRTSSIGITDIVNGAGIIVIALGIGGCGSGLAFAGVGDAGVEQARVFTGLAFDQRVRVRLADAGLIVADQLGRTKVIVLGAAGVGAADTLRVIDIQPAANAEAELAGIFDGAFVVVVAVVGVDIYEAHVVNAGDIDAEWFQGPGVVASPACADVFRSDLAAIQPRTKCVTIGFASSVVTDETIVAFAATAFTAVIAALQVGAVRGADILANPLGAERHIVRAVAATAVAAIVPALQPIAIGLARCFIAEVFFTDESILAIATLALVFGAGKTAFDVVTNHVALDGAGALLAKPVGTVATVPATAVVPAFQSFAARDAQYTAPSFADVADAAIAATPATAVRPADHAVTGGQALALPEGRTLFPFAAVSANAAAAVLAADLANARRGAGFVALGNIELTSIINSPGSVATSSTQTGQKHGRNSHQYKLSRHTQILRQRRFRCVSIVAGGVCVK